MLTEIFVPKTKPETEWVRGRALQKVSPQRDHARLQTTLGAMLEAWSRSGSARTGEVGSEWRFRLAPPGERRRPLVPDIAFVRAEKLRGLSIEAIQIPAFAPTASFEILSPDDERTDVDDKIDVYLRSGTELVAIIDPAARTIELHDAKGFTRMSAADSFTHLSLPDFRFAIDVYFDAALSLIDQ